MDRRSHPQDCFNSGRVRYMLERVERDGVVFYRSALLARRDIPHGFSTRIGGVSAGPFATLNLGNPADCATPDPAANIQENYARFFRAAGLSRAGHGWVRQVHGKTVAVFSREAEQAGGESKSGDVPAGRWHGQVEADAIITDVPDMVISVRSADCVPVFIADTEGQWVGVVHAGWRGIVANAPGETVRALVARGVPAARLVAAIGPMISTGHFEVGADVVRAFTESGLRDCIVDSDNGAKHANLGLAANMQLDRAGVRAIEGGELCTYGDPHEFFSHRRDRGLTGRMAAAIALPEKNRAGDQPRFR